MSEHTLKTPRGGTFHLWHLEPIAAIAEISAEENSNVLLTDGRQTITKERHEKINIPTGFK